MTKKKGKRSIRSMALIYDEDSNPKMKMAVEFEDVRCPDCGRPMLDISTLERPRLYSHVRTRARKKCDVIAVQLDENDEILHVFRSTHF